MNTELLNQTELDSPIDDQDVRSFWDIFHNWGNETTIDDLSSIEDPEERWWTRFQLFAFARQVNLITATLLESENPQERVLATRLTNAALHHLDYDWQDYRDRCQRRALANAG